MIIDNVIKNCRKRADERRRRKWWKKFHQNSILLGLYIYALGIIYYLFIY